MLEAMAVIMRNERHHTMRRIAGLLPAILLASGQLLAQPAADTAHVSRRDTLRTYRADSVQVRAASILPREASGSQPLAVVTRREIQAGNAIDLADAVAYAPGVFVKQYGGPGGLRTISLRGTSAQQSVILIDGVRYRSSANDAFDLGNIPAAALQEVEVLRGGNAALYGANALGGVVNLITRSRLDRPFALAASGGIGSFGERTAGVTATANIGAQQVQAGIHATASDGNYPFAFNEFGQSEVITRDNADFRNLHADASWNYQDDDGRQIGAALYGFDSRRGVPGAVVQGNREQPHARLDERDLFALATFSETVDGWDLRGTASGRLNGMRYRDPDARLNGPDGLDDRFDGSEAAATVRARRLLANALMVEGSAEISYAALSGDNLDPSAGSFVHRLQTSVVAGANWFLEDGLFGCETAIDAGMRADLYSDLDPALSPSVGASWRVGLTPLHLRLRAALGHRAPSFTEQYYLNYGNRNLRPEQGRTLEAGCTYELLETMVLEANGFLMNTRDQIVATPRSPVSWSAENIARVQTRGVELAASGTLLNGMLALRASWTLMRAEDESGGPANGRLLVYVPQELLNGVAEVRIGPCSAAFTWNYASHRYASPTNEYESLLPHYMVLGANVAGRCSIAGMSATCRLACLNLLDAEYQVVRSYPMPGRSFRAEIAVGI